MTTPKTKQTIHESGLVEVKATIGKTLDGKRIQKSFYGASKLEAQRKADNYKLEQTVADRTGDVFIKKEYTFAEWAQKWLEIHKKPHVSENAYLLTYENTILRHLNPYFGKAQLTDVKSVDVQAFFATKNAMSGSMLGKMRNCLYGIFETAIDNDLCYKNPSKKITLTSTAAKHEKRVYSTAEIAYVKEAMLARMPEVVILLETGLRRGELLGLQWADIDFSAGVLSVKHSIADSKTQLTRVSLNSPKHGSCRDISLQKMSLEVLNSITRLGDYIFPKPNGSPQSPNTWGQKLGRFMETLDDSLPRLTAHELRHTFGTDLHRQGIDIYTIQKLMGHKDLKMTTELYVHNEIDELKKAMKIAL